jgi:exopolysaccharide biosynthesis polyprenyl glycosylphosphotransferase
VKPSKHNFENSSRNELATRLIFKRASSSPHDSLTGISGFIKRVLDVAGALAALLVLAPIFAIIALAVRLEGGRPVFYRQTRIGLNGREFTIIKFRTMHADAENGLGPIWAVPHDPRCTRVGRYLRRFGLDELPQLWNVLRGDMSLVGPRPERPEFIDQFLEDVPGYETRHNVHAGITGYAQIHGWRGYTSLEERLRHDIHYIQNWSLVLDLYILLMTPLRGWSERTRSGV